MAEYIFSMMPLRHSPSIDNLEFILARLNDKENSNTKALELLQRFRKQTTRRLQHLQDRAKLEADDEILERHPFQADESNILDHPLVKTTEMFLKKHFALSPYHTNHPQAKVKKHIVLLSLSGGVDSMVISKILALLKQSKRVPIDEIVGIHIDYANRPESGREAAYVQTWCDMIGLHYRVRVVNEVTRGVTSRDDYEKISRSIRYACYQDTIAAALRGEFCPTTTTETDNEPVQIHVSGVMFGHHVGDVQENVISNIMRGSSPLDLSGMTESSFTNHVYVWRPLLSHEKTLIYAFAHTYGVPYFKDTTPSWSTRGKLRNQLIILLEVYGHGCLRNLSNLAQESDAMQALVFQNLYAPFLQGAKRFLCGISVNIRAYIHQPVCFWKEMLKELMHSMGMAMIREKSVQNFVERISEKPIIKGNPKTYGWLELRKGYHIYLSEDYDLLILKENVLRKNLVLTNPATTRNQLMQQQQTANSTGTNRQGKQKEGTTAVEEEEEEEEGASLFVIKGHVQFSADQLVAFETLSRTTASEEGEQSVVEQNNHNLLPTEWQVEYDTITWATKQAEEFVPLAKDETHAPLALTATPGNPLIISPLVTLSSATSSSTLPGVQEIIYGPWRIQLFVSQVLVSAIQAQAYITGKRLNEQKKWLTHLSDILPGGFEYDMIWPSVSTQTSHTMEYVFLHDVVSKLLQQTKGIGSLNYFFQDESSPLAKSLASVTVEMKSMELRLRDGLPLLLPWNITNTVETSFYSVIKVVYQYQGVVKDM